MQKQMDGQTYQQTDGLSDRRLDGQTDRWKDGWTDCKKDQRTDQKSKNRWTCMEDLTDRQTYTQNCCYVIDAWETCETSMSEIVIWEQMTEMGWYRMKQ